MRFALAGLSLAGLAAAASQPGLKIVARDTSPAAVVETTEYIQPDRSRIEWRLMSLRPPAGSEPPAGNLEHLRSAWIVRCDLQKGIALSYDDRTYMTGPLGAVTFEARALFASIAPPPPPPAPRDTPDLVVETTTVQTGERKTAFGYTARRVVTIRKDIPRSAAARAPSEIETDGWYIDLETRPSCERSALDSDLQAVVAIAGAGPTARSPTVAFKEIGAPERGYPIDVKTTSRTILPGASSEHTIVTHKVVIELSREPLDPALFELPPGFRHASGPLAAFAERWGRTWDMVKALVASWFR